MEKLLLTTNEAAETLGIGRSTLYDLIRSGKLRTVKIGRRRLVPVAALTDVIKTLTDESDAA
ncbi:helix-turn-helix domain-containing protein [Parafrankia sp. FMc6]|uniref:helix-turn-helix domain-containing protein n=1 Tax=Parafrankia soli TaxID=2599596 RepID=UPI0034D400EB